MNRTTLAILLVIVQSARAAPVASTGIDLHIHPTIELGMGVFPRFDRCDFDSMLQSGAAIQVVSLYAHPLFTLGKVRESIREQIQRVYEKVRLHPQFVLAHNLSEARDALAKQKKILILSLETAAGILETDADLKEFIDDGAIRIVTLLHMSDDQYGGSAFYGGDSFKEKIKMLANPEGWFHWLKARTYRDGIAVNPLGLTEAGKAIAQKLIEHRVWIDLSHASDLAQDDLMPILAEARHPLLYTHTSMRKFYHGERAISDEQLRRIRKFDGMIGLLATDDFMGDEGKGFEAFERHYRHAVQEIGGERVVLGSDFNAPLRKLSAPANPTGTSLDQWGFARQAQTPELWQALRKRGDPVPASFDPNVEKFLTLWERVRRYGLSN